MGGGRLLLSFLHFILWETSIGPTMLVELVSWNWCFIGFLLDVHCCECVWCFMAGCFGFVLLHCGQRYLWLYCISDSCFSKYVWACSMHTPTQVSFQNCCVSSKNWATTCSTLLCIGLMVATVWCFSDQFVL